ncbi:MAG TPA: hypothetical protein VIY48_20695 [Candidatus Paceibacterota bacterium]
MFTIVYARAEKTGLEPTGRYVTRDANLFPEFKQAWEARAGIWLNKGTEYDADNARLRLSLEGYEIFIFPTNERDPLGRAREAVLARAKKAEAG